VVYIGLGSNIGDRQSHIQRAIAEINTQIGKILRTSSQYESEPLGFDADQNFINMVVEVETPLSTRKLVEGLLHIEHEMGRKRSNTGAEKVYTSRIIDLDLLVDGEIMYNLPELSVPHPRLSERKFVLAPLAELSPNLVPPGLNGQSISQLLLDCKDHSVIHRIS
jgi:2-amino-4-hydroxy-6-hydroxymethyldihydropteridine diphosphokinase